MKTNAEILNTIRANASSEYQERVPEALGVGNTGMKQETLKKT